MSGDVVTCAGCEARVRGWALVPAIERDARPRALCSTCSAQLAELAIDAAARLDPADDNTHAAAAALHGLAYRLRGRS